MIVHDLDVFRVRFLPTKADPELVIHAHTPLSGASALEQLKAVSRRRAHVLDAPGQVELPELAKRRALDVGESGNALKSEQDFGVGAFERPDRHQQIVTCYVISVKRARRQDVQ